MPNTAAHYLTSLAALTGLLAGCSGATSAYRMPWGPQSGRCTRDRLHFMQIPVGLCQGQSRRGRPTRARHCFRSIF